MDKLHTNKLKSKVDKLDVVKLVPAPVDLSKLGDVVKSDVVTKMHVMLRSKILNIKYLPDISNLATNTTLNAKTNEVKKEIPSITNLAATATLNAKINEVENKIPNITNLATTTALTAAESKKLDVSNLVKKN